MHKSASEIIKEQGIVITSSPSGGYEAKMTKQGVVVKAASLEKLFKIIRKMYE